MTNSIYFIRHGQIHNPEKIIYGRLPNFVLSQEGKTTIKKTAQFLKRLNISKIISSPLLRTKQSASIISKELDISNILESSFLLEFRSSFEGLPSKTLAETKFDYYFSKNRKENDETMAEIFKRMKQFTDEEMNKNSSENIAVVGHGDPIMILLAGLAGLPFNLSSIRTKDYIKYGEVIKISLRDSDYVISKIFKLDNQINKYVSI